MVENPVGSSNIEVHTDEDSGRRYSVNNDTGETKWMDDDKEDVASKPKKNLPKKRRTPPTNRTREPRPNCPTGGPKKSAMAEIITPIARRKNLLGNHLRAAAVVPPQNPLKKSLKKSLPKKRRIPQMKHTRGHKLNCQTDGPVKHRRTAKNITPIARRKKLLGNHLRAAPVVRLWQNQEENLPEKRRGW